MTTRTVLVAPNQYPDLDGEQALADEFGLELRVAADQPEFSAGMATADVVLVTPYGKVRADDFDRLDKCRAVVRYGIGYDNIDVEAAKRVGVPVSIVPDATSEEVASHALAMGLALVRRIPQGQSAIDDGQWAGSIGLDTAPLSELRVGVLGLGRIGRQVARLWSAIGAHVSAYDPYASISDPSVTAGQLDDVVKSADLLTLHLPLTDTTANLISRETLRLMRPGAAIVNVSRGGLIDEDALAESLLDGHLAGAGLDTFSTEPLPAGHALRSAPNVILTPHVAWRSRTSMKSLQRGAVDRARHALSGREIPDRVS